MGFKNQPMTTATPSQDKVSLLSCEVRKEIDKWIAKYPPEWKQSAVMAALRIVQDDNGGWLSRELLDDVANYLAMPPIAVYEVATFYSMFELKPVGRNKVCVCTNVSCMINGSDKIVEHMEQKLGIKLGPRTPTQKRHENFANNFLIAYLEREDVEARKALVEAAKMRRCLG